MYSNIIYITLLSKSQEEKILSLFIKNKFAVKIAADNGNLFDGDNELLSCVMACYIESKEEEKATVLMKNIKKIFEDNNIKYLSLVIRSSDASSSWSAGNVKFNPEEQMPTTLPYRTMGT